MRSQLTETITRVQGMVTYVRTNLTDEEFNLFLDLVAPEPEQATIKKPRKRSKKGKSQRAESLAHQIKTTTIQRCTAEVDNKPCGEPQGHALHEDSTYANYHPFVSASPAQSARTRSGSRKSSGEAPAASSETGKDDVVGAAAGSGD